MLSIENWKAVFRILVFIVSIFLVPIVGAGTTIRSYEKTLGCAKYFGKPEIFTLEGNKNVTLSLMMKGLRLGWKGKLVSINGEEKLITKIPTDKDYLNDPFGDEFGFVGRIYDPELVDKISSLEVEIYAQCLGSVETDGKDMWPKGDTGAGSMLNCKAGEGLRIMVKKPYCVEEGSFYPVFIVIKTTYNDDEENLKNKIFQKSKHKVNSRASVLEIFSFS